MNGSSTSLSDIVDVSISSFQKVKDIAIFGGAYIFFMDGEKYRALNNIRTHSYFKKRCLEEFKKIKVPEVIHQFKEKMGSYLPKKYLNQT